MHHFVNDFTRFLHQEIDNLTYDLTGSTAELAILRLQRLAKAFPLLYWSILEPWQSELHLEESLKIIKLCSQLHLYVRILDDALDENLNVYRLNLLRVQPLFWQTIAELSILKPNLINECVILVKETIRAVEIDDKNPTPSLWGQKNHHLLIPVLLLSDNNQAYRDCKLALSAMLALSQSIDEKNQNILNSTENINNLMIQIPKWLSEEHLINLKKHGWHQLAERMIYDAKSLLNQ